MPEVGPGAAAPIAAATAAATASTPTNNGGDDGGAVLTVEDSDFRWGTDNPHQPPQLRGVSFAVRPGELVVVAGPVGAGKSTLIEAVLGEVSCIRGAGARVRPGSRLAYCAQQPWIQAGTVRDNILFARAEGFLDPDGYDRAVAACALMHDLARLEQGDLTQIGELGINLSGGWVGVWALGPCVLMIDALAYACNRSALLLCLPTHNNAPSSTQQAGSARAWRWPGRCTRMPTCTSWTTC